jgi:rod shape-determining protein MreB
MKKKFNLLIGESTAERIKKEIGSAIPTGSEKTFLMKGRDIRTGTPKEVILSEKDTSEALEGVVTQIVNAIKHALENTPPELSSDLVDSGMVLAGGGAYLKNLDKLIKKETGLPVTIAEDALSCVAIGTGKALEQEGIFSSMLTSY